MPLNVGDCLGPYKVTAKIGEGGMGEVYQARDTTLDRDVALKVLPEAFTADPDRLARFEREAKVLASLNHPNIGSIYGLEEQDGIRALVLELVEGPTLADRISKGPIPLDEALPIASQIAEALEAAHEAGVIHRDLKPANIKVRDDGTVKVLDFGLAKALDPNPQGDPSQSPTLTAAATQMGVIMGTAAYMSPEQAAGQTSDKRSDAWSYGVVLYEMLTGQRLFTGETVSHVLAKVLDRELDLSALTTSTPPPIRRLLRRCLERKPKRRLSDLGEALSHLEDALAPVEEAPSAVPSVPPVVQPAGWRQSLPLALGISAVAVVIASLAVWSVMQPESARLVRFAVAHNEALPLFMALVSPDVAIAPDGEHIAYLTGSVGLGAEQLHVRPLDQLTSEILVAEGELNSPFFSPDSQSVGFYDRRVNPPVLKRVSVLGGPASTICDLPSDLRSASWGADGTIVFASADTMSGLWRVAAVGGAPEQLTTPDPEQGEVDHVWPEILPGGEAVLFTIRANPIEDSQIAVLSLDTHEQKVVIRGGSYPRYSPTGHLLYGVQGNLWAVAFDLNRLETVGDPVPVQEGVLTKPLGAANFGISENGRLVYVPDTGDAGVLTSRLVVTGRDGAGTPLAEIAGTGLYPRYSPDGTRVAFAVLQNIGGGGGNDADLWVLDVERGTRTRLTSEGNNRFYPVWSPDGSQLAFADGAGATNRVLLVSADGSGEPETLLDRNERQFPTSWAADGNLMTLQTEYPDTARDLYVLALDGDLTPEPFLATPFQERGASFSPDGQWIAYVSDESGQDEVYVRPYPGPGGQVIISTGGGEEAVWGPDGSELFYRNGDQVMVVEVTTGQTFSAGAPTPLFAAPYALDTTRVGGNPNYDISPDGAQFIFVELNSSTGGEGSAQINVVLNWFEELKARVPVP